MSPTSPLLIPAAFLGQSTDVRREWRKIAMRPVRTRALATAFGGVEWHDVAASNAPITLFGPPLTRRDCFHPYWFMEKLTAVAQTGLTSESISDPAERRVWYERMRDLILDGRDQFWVA